MQSLQSFFHQMWTYKYVEDLDNWDNWEEIDFPTLDSKCNNNNNICEIDENHKDEEINVAWKDWFMYIYYSIIYYRNT